MAAAPVPVPVPAQPRGRLPRWACRASLFQPREPAFWLYVLLLVGTGVAAISAHLCGLDHRLDVGPFVLVHLGLGPGVEHHPIALTG